MSPSKASRSSWPRMAICQYQSPSWAVPIARFQVRLIRPTIPNRSRA